MLILFIFLFFKSYLGTKLLVLSQTKFVCLRIIPVKQDLIIVVILLGNYSFLYSLHRLTCQLRPLKYCKYIIMNNHLSFRNLNYILLHIYFISHKVYVNFAVSRYKTETDKKVVRCLRVIPLYLV